MFSSSSSNHKCKPILFSLINALFFSSLMLFGLKPIKFCKTIWFTDDIIDNKEEVCEEEEGLHLIEEQTLEGRPDGDERLGESHLDVPEGETGVEDEQRLGGQSLEDGEVQPSEPPPTPPPQHTEEGNLIYY